MYPATIVTDLGFGDAGKGSVVDALARRMMNPAVVRFNGGGQAAHNVITADGQHHTFSQFGSGTFVPGVRTHLSRFMLVDPLTLLNEAAHLASVGCPDALSRLTVDGDAKVVTPYHKIANRFRETLRGDGRHGSCGMGIGETMASDLLVPTQTVRVQDLRDPAVLTGKLARIHRRYHVEFGPSLEQLAGEPHLADACALLAKPYSAGTVARTLCDAGRRMHIVTGRFLRTLAQQGSLIFEGAQGVLLDEWHGFHPYTTWSTTTNANAHTLLDEINFDRSVHRLGVLRAYHTRHGAGPFPTEDHLLSILMPDTHNGTGLWQREFRVGWFDAVLARYAIAACGGVDSLAVTCLDRWAGLPRPQFADSYVIDPSQAARARCVATVGADGEHVTDFTVKPFLTDLTYQESLTAVAAAATPLLQEAPVHHSAFLRLISELTGVNVSMESWGPTAADKRFRNTIVTSLSA